MYMWGISLLKLLKLLIRHLAYVQCIMLGCLLHGRFSGVLKENAVLG
jgi:hypothetical protein